MTVKALGTYGRRGWAIPLAGLAVAEVIGAITLTVVVGWSWQDALEAFIVTNSLMGMAFALCGGIIAWYRPGNLVGWLFLADALGHATSAFCSPLIKALYEADAPVGLQRAIITLFSYSWPWSIGLFLPLALLLFPDGRPPSRAWRPVVMAVVLTAPLFVIEMGAGAGSLHPDLPAGYLTLPWYDSLKPLWLFSEIRTFAALVLAVASLIYRFRKGSQLQRRQLLWLLLATITAVGFVLPWAFIAGTPVVVLFAIPLIPIAVTVAIVRHQALDIKLVVSRAIAWVLLSFVVVAAYVILLSVLDRFVSERLGRSAVATVVIATLAAPVLPRLQRLVDRAMYGDRSDPARIASQIGRQLVAAPDQEIPSVTSAVRRALRLPYVAISTSEGVLAEDGGQSGEIGSVPLEYGGEVVGDLVVGLRPGERDLSAADRNVLTLLAVPLAVALHASALSRQVQSSREKIVAAREEERRRLRRDLHDGLGPTLTGVALSADAATNLLEVEPGKVRELLESLGKDARNAIGEVRRLVENLRPPSLDEVGLADALRRRSEQLRWRNDGSALKIRVDVPDRLPELPAAIEVAAYRIATEALTNVARHSRASSVVLRLQCGDSLDVLVRDDGPTNGAKWHPGVGLQAMRERAEELGGRFEAGPTESGGRVHASFPLDAA